jgi:hypothetical protein
VEQLEFRLREEREARAGLEQLGREHTDSMRVLMELVEGGPGAAAAAARTESSDGCAMGP